MAVNIIAFITVCNTYLVSAKKENLQAVVFKMSYFQTQRGRLQGRQNLSRDSFVGFGGRVPPFENNLRQCRAAYLRYLGDRLDGRAVV